MSRQRPLMSATVLPHPRLPDELDPVGDLPSSALPSNDMPDIGAPDGTRATIRVQTLGASRMVVGDQLIGLHNALLFALMLRLVYTPGMSVRREELLLELWPDLEPVRQRGNLRQALYKLRGMGIDASIRGNVVYLDALQVEHRFAVYPTFENFEQDITRGTEPYGVFLPGFIPPTDRLAEWFEQTREEVHADVRRVLVDVLRQRRDRADWNGAQMVAKWILQIDALNEDATLALAECIAVTGSKVEAIAVLDRYLTELGAEAGDIRLPATLLRKRFSEAVPRRRSVALVTDKYFVGRDQEMSDLTLAMRRARWHDGSAVLLHGPAGMGKTRVVTELSRIALMDGHRQVLLECRESIAKQPLVALLEALPELLTAPGAAGCAPESLMVIRKLLGMATESEKAEQDAMADDTPPEGLTASERFELAMRTIRSQSIRHAVVDLMAALSDERPIFLLVEDAHWLDDASWEVLADVIQRVNEMRVCVVITSRFASIREERPGRMPTTLSVRRLPPLPLHHLQFLVQSIAEEHSAEVPAEVESWITGGCEGSPLMLRALLEHWLATGAAVGVPPTLNSLLDQRIDRLDATAQHTLQAIGLLGKFASLDRIKLVLELPMHELIHSLEQLELSGCLDTSHAALVITHDLVRQVAVRKLSPLVETALRATIGDVLESEYSRTEDQAILLEALMHIELSGRPDVLHRFIGKYEEALLESGRPAAVLRAIGTLQGAVPHLQNDRRLEHLQIRLDTQAGDYKKALRNSLGSLVLPSNASAVEVSELEALLASVDAAQRADPVIDRNDLARFAADVATTPSFLLSSRIRAAEIGLTIAANTCDRAIAVRCFSSLQAELSAPELREKSDRLSLLYETIFGDVRAAERIAKDVLKRCEGRLASTVIAGDISRAAFALRLVGDVKASVSAFTKHYEMAVELQAPKLAQYSAWQAAQIALEQGNGAQLREWNQKLASLLEYEDDPISSGFAVAHYCRCAIEERNVAKATVLVAKLKGALPKLPTLKASAYLFALELGTELLRHSWVPSSGLLAAAMDKHAKTAAYGTADYLTSVIADSLTRVSSKQAAQDFITHYFHTARRERSEPPPALRRIMERVGL